MFADLNWYGPGLNLLDKEATLNAILNGTWPVHQALVFSRLSLAA